ncbi:MAG: hypothetical protein Q8O55_11235, partial [Dehalococcoidales bacterium]|nr:hypothetical protein [Dehalococcoidales bacterium]
VVESLLKRKALKKLKESSMETYDKRFNVIINRFRYLPTSADPISEFLNEFTGETGRHKQTFYDLLNSIFCHAVDYFGMPFNPLKYLERPGISHKCVFRTKLGHRSGVKVGQGSGPNWASLTEQSGPPLKPLTK